MKEMSPKRKVLYKIAKEYEAGNYDKKELINKYQSECDGEIRLMEVSMAIIDFCPSEFVEKRKQEEVEQYKVLRSKGLKPNEIVKEMKVSHGEFDHIRKRASISFTRKDYSVDHYDIEAFKEAVQVGDRIKTVISTTQMDDYGHLVKMDKVKNVTIKAKYPHFAETDFGCIQWGHMLVGQKRCLNG